MGTGLLLKTSHRVFDTDTPLLETAPNRLAALGYDVAGRYVRNSRGDGAGDLTRDEVWNILSPMKGGMKGLFAIQHAHGEGWTPSVELAAADAQAAIVATLACGYALAEVALAIVCDMEGIGREDLPVALGPGSQAAAYADRWCTDIRAEGYQPVVYVGWRSLLATADLAGIGGDPEWWVDYGPLSKRPIPDKGYVLRQQAPTSAAGIAIDPDVVLVDDRLMVLGA